MITYNIIQKNDRICVPISNIIELGDVPCTDHPKFSLIIPLQRTSKVVILHGSHLSYTRKDNPIHLGSFTSVEIPSDCMILFHGLLSHCGDIS